MVDSSFDFGDVGSDLKQLVNGEILDLNGYPENLSIRAVVDNIVHEVHFFIDGVIVDGNGQQIPPYSLADDEVGGKIYTSDTLKILTDALTIKATPYQDGARGADGTTEGVSLEITFGITDSGDRRKLFSTMRATS